MLAYPPVWLRDNCSCAECRDPHSGQKLFGIVDLPADLAIAGIEESADSIVVTFAPDGHVAEFSRAWLDAQAAPGTGDGRTELDKQLWRAADLADRLPVADWTVYRDHDRERVRVLKAVRELGFAILRGTPTGQRTVLDLAATFGFVRTTNYGELFDVRAEVRPNNLAFTRLAIAPHTDNPYRDPVPTLQLLHCLENSVEGGESGLVDGFGAAALLREEDPEAFAVLTGTLVTFAWSDATASLRADRPLIDVDPDGRIREVRFNNRSMQAMRLPAPRLEQFYRAYRRFAAIIARPDLMLTFRLDAGDCVIFDNTRLLHARTAFADAGRRHLQGCYADLDGLASTLTILESRR